MNTKSMASLIVLLCALLFSTPVSARQPRALEAETIVEQIDFTGARLWLRMNGSTDVHEYVWSSETRSGKVTTHDLSKGTTLRIRYRSPFIGGRRLVSVEILRATELPRKLSNSSVEICGAKNSKSPHTIYVSH